MKIFIVEDDTFYGEMLKYHVSLNPDYEVERFATGKECLNNLYKNPKSITLDYSLPDISGMEVLRKIKEFNPEIPVIIISGQEDVRTAVSLLKEGAYDYFVKDEDTKDRLWNALKNIKESIELKQEINVLKEEIGKKYQFSNVIKGSSEQIKSLFNLMDKATKTSITVSITGETGTGKDLVAKAIHYNSPRAKFPFVAINVTAIPHDLIESELFGHEKGSFTGANTRKIGKFEEASKGTLFLDEIGEMDLNMQTKLLRALQEKEITRVGGNAVVKIDPRIIVATHKNLSEEVKKGNFRQDLYYRLLGLPIYLPPLRERGSDILLLSKYFIDEFVKENKLHKKVISQGAQEKLISYSFPGNVRELKAIVELAVVLSNTDVIEENDISLNITTINNDFLLEEDSLDGYTKKIINHYLRKYNQNVLEVAKRLKVGKSTIYRMLKNNEL